MSTPRWPEPITLAGHGVTLRPLEPDDLPALFACTNPQTFQFYSVPPPADSPANFSAHLRTLLADPGRLHFAVIAGGTLVGSTAYYDARKQHRALEIGYTFYHPAHRGTLVNPACKLLLIGHAIERLGCVRVQIKTDRRNTISQRAIERLGATYEGTLRNHFIQPDGYIRDTVMYSITPQQWPGIKEGLLRRLASAPAAHRPAG